MVLLKEENTSLLSGSLGRIEETHTGRDDIMRTQKGVVKYALLKVSRLIISDDA